MGDLTRDFSRKEFECKCGCGFFKENPLLLATLQKIRDHANRMSMNETDIPIYVTSGCRCREHNKKVGGAMRSRHLSCEAADIRIPGWDSDRLITFIRKLVIDDRIYVGYAYKVDDNVVHVDVRIPQSNTVRGWTASIPKA